MAHLPGITIGRPSETCTATGDPLAPGDRIVSLLLLDDTHGTRRIDVAESAWDGGWRPWQAGEAPHDTIALWRGFAQKPRDKSNNRPVDDEDLVALFDQIAEPQDAQTVELRYVLAWMLVRRRRLRFEGQRRGNLRVRRVTATGGLIDDQPIEVADPGLDEDQLEQAMDRVAGLLLGEPEAPVGGEVP